MVGDAAGLAPPLSGILLSFRFGSLTGIVRIKDCESEAWIHSSITDKFASRAYLKDSLTCPREHTS